MSRAFMIKQAPFKPTDIGGCQMWLDAADATTITLSGSIVTQWRDKSGSGNNAMPVYTGPTLVQNVKNSLPGLSFSGGNIMKCGAFLTSTSFSAFIVVNNTSGTKVSMGVWKVQYGSYVITDINLKVGTENSSTYNQTSITVPDFTTTHMYAITLSSSSASGSSFTYNGSYDGSNTVITGTSSSGNAATCAQEVSIGGLMENNSPQYMMTGYIYEVIFFSNALTSTQRQQVESYLAQKWGLRQQLPQDHPGTRGIVYPSQPIPTAIYWRYDTNPAGISRPANVLPIPPIVCSAIYKTTLQTAVFTYRGSLQSFAVPSTISPTTITVYMWGAGGGGYYPTQSYGGAGCYLTGILTVTPAETLYVLVGQGGTIQYPSQTGLSTRFGGGGGIISTGGNGNAQYNGSGGGRSAIQRSGTDIVSAGAGGGCGTQAGSGNGHDGGTGSWTGTGGNGANDKYGLGGTQTSGGASQGNGAAGTALVGGRADPWGGGGGGGFFGGGAGSDNNSYGSGGGGGSSYTDLLSSKSGSNGTLNVAPNTASPYYISGVAVGGTQALSGNGGNGLVVITYYA